MNEDATTGSYFTPGTIDLLKDGKGDGLDLDTPERRVLDEYPMINGKCVDFALVILSARSRA